MSKFEHPDAIVNGGGSASAEVLKEPPQGATDTLDLRNVTLVDLVENARLADLDRHESYLHAAQDVAKQYDWDGNLITDGGAPIAPGWVVPMAQRRPIARYDLAKVIVGRFTSLLFGTDRFPEITIPGDATQETFVKGLVKAARLPLACIKARNLGGSTGTATASFRFDEGKPRIETHNPKHVTVLDWRDRSEFQPRKVLKAYKYPKRVFDPESGKPKMVDFFYARLWTETDETVWEPIPYSVASTKGWSNAPRDTVPHPFGFCPFVWTQNLPNDEDEDGFSDYHGLLGNLDEMNRLMSAGTRAVKANSDPTLVVKIDPAYNDGQIRKGAGAAIFSPAGADYLTLPADAVKALHDTKEDLRRATLDTANVVDLDPEKLTGAAQSAAALRILFAPMLAQADIYREQYGELFVKPLITLMIRAAIALTKANKSIVLPPNVKDLDDGTKVTEPCVIGESDEVVLNWNPYFSPTWPDIKAATEAAQLANGGKPVISQRTSIAAVQSLYGVENVDDEMAAIRDQAEEEVKLAQKAMAGAPGVDPAALDGKEPSQNPGFGQKLEEAPEEPEE